jgi:hypothetical protein
MNWTQTGPFSFRSFKGRLQIETQAKRESFPFGPYVVKIDGNVESIEDTLEQAFLAAKMISVDLGMQN